MTAQQIMLRYYEQGFIDGVIVAFGIVGIVLLVRFVWRRTKWVQP